MMANRAPRAPRYSRGRGRRRRPPPAGRARLADIGQPDLGQQTGQRRGVHPVRRRGGPSLRASSSSPRSAELGVQVLPLPDPQEVQVLVPAQPPECVARQGLPLARAGSPTGRSQARKSDVSGPESLSGSPFDSAQGASPGRALAAAAPRTGGAGRRPCSRCSAGRSRGSWIDRPETMISTSRRQPWRSAASSIRPSRGSSGSAASRRPIGGQPGQHALPGSTSAPSS